MSSKRVLITGASGYLGSWIAREFLCEGWDVIGTVREAGKKEKVGHLPELGERLPGNLELLEADLLSEGAFDQAAGQVSVLVHAAAPFLVGDVADPREELLKPALQGTRNVLNAADKSRSVERVILTSSVVAIHNDAKEIEHTEKGYFTEAHWNRRGSLGYQPYNYAKSEAEREAWRIAGESSWRLVVLNPGLILGPALSSRSDNTSTTLFLRLMGGEFSSGAPALSFGVVDVREVARAHFEAAVREGAEGRHIIVATHATFLEIAQTVDRLYPGVHPVPKRELSKALLYLFGPKIGLSWRYIRRNVGIPVRYDNRKSKERLGLFYRPLEETVRDQRLKLLEDGLL